MPADPVEIAREDVEMLAEGIDYGCGCSMGRSGSICGGCCKRAVYVARSLLSAHAEIARLRGLLGEALAGINEEVSAHDGEDPFGTSCPNCVAGVPVPHTLACRIAAELRKEKA